ncbi:MAG: PUA domain-containing protein [Candidatus Hodarchaeota archaeon]
MKSLSAISSNIFSDFQDLKNSIYISIEKRIETNNFPKIYLISSELKQILKNPNIYDYINLVGLYFGFIKRGEFFLSLEGAEFLYARGLIPNLVQVHVNEGGEKSVLYGNNILKNMVVKKSYNFKENSFLIIFNKEEEIIALGRAIIDSNQIQNLKPEDLIAINLSDKGIYLREKQ